MTPEPGAAVVRSVHHAYAQSVARSVPFVLLLLAATMIVGASNGAATQPPTVGLSAVDASLRSAGFKNLALYTNFGRVDMHRYLNHPKSSTYMVAVPVYRPRYGPISAVWFASVPAAKHFVSSEVDPTRTPPPTGLPPDIVWGDIHEVRICNVVLTTGRYPTVRERFQRAARLLRKAC
jgi:hypothetical protein